MGTLDEERVKRIRSQSGDRQLVSSSYQSTFSEWVARKVLERSGCEADQLGGAVQFTSHWEETLHVRIGAFVLLNGLAPSLSGLRQPIDLGSEVLVVMCVRNLAVSTDGVYVTLSPVRIRREFPRSRNRGLSGNREGRIHVAAIPLA